MISSVGACRAIKLDTRLDRALETVILLRRNARFLIKPEVELLRKRSIELIELLQAEVGYDDDAVSF
jgi:hypothetical protein